MDKRRLASLCSQLCWSARPSTILHALPLALPDSRSELIQFAGGDWGGLIVFLLGRNHAQNCKAVHTNFPYGLPRWTNPWHILQGLNYYLPFLKQVGIWLAPAVTEGA